MLPCPIHLRHLSCRNVTLPYSFVSSLMQKCYPALFTCVISHAEMLPCPIHLHHFWCRNVTLPYLLCRNVNLPYSPVSSLVQKWYPINKCPISIGVICCAEILACKWIRMPYIHLFISVRKCSPVNEHPTSTPVIFHAETLPCKWVPHILYTCFYPVNVCHTDPFMSCSGFRRHHCSCLSYVLCVTVCTTSWSSMCQYCTSTAPKPLID